MNICVWILYEYFNMFGKFCDISSKPQVAETMDHDFTKTWSQV